MPWKPARWPSASRKAVALAFGTLAIGVAIGRTRASGGSRSTSWWCAGSRSRNRGRTPHGGLDRFLPAAGTGSASSMLSVLRPWEVSKTTSLSAPLRASVPLRSWPGMGLSVAKEDASLREALRPLLLARAVVLHRAGVRRLFSTPFAILRNAAATALRCRFMVLFRLRRAGGCRRLGIPSISAAARLIVCFPEFPFFSYVGERMWITRLASRSFVFAP